MKAAVHKAKLGQSEELAAIQRLDEQVRRLAFGKTREIAHPPFFHGKQEDRLHPLFVKII